MPTLVLASTSPSRLQVLRNAGIDPTVIAPEVDEDAILASCRAAGADPAATVTALASAKADAVVVHLPPPTGDTVVIACDSMLLYDGHLSGKPHTVDECVRRWEAQRGAEAELVTGHCLLHVAGDGAPGRRHAHAVRSAVRFGDPSDADIRAYAASGEALGCAGAFTLEGLGGWFIDGIEGDATNVLGLSLPHVRRTLAGWGMDVSAFWNRRSGAAAT